VLLPVIHSFYFVGVTSGIISQYISRFESCITDAAGHEPYSFVQGCRKTVDCEDGGAREGFAAMMEALLS
jgi:hypothetical protein